tara:strand:+ start:22771 stop:23763 length:993 start_codon:yes stop_codon:yes gene_type:complete
VFASLFSALFASTASVALVSTQELEALTAERQLLTRELEQFNRTIALLIPAGTTASQSSNPAVRKLALEVLSIKEHLIDVTEREVALLQEQISAAKTVAQTAPTEVPADASQATDRPREAMESKPLRSYAPTYDLAAEEDRVKRLHALLANYYRDLKEAELMMPTQDEVALREAAQRDAAVQARVPFSVDKVRLNGSEGSTALTQITQRLSDSSIPESRRDVAPICSIKTRLFGKLIGSENRSLRPVGKNHYVARIRLQPGNSTLRVSQHEWEVRLPQNATATDYLVTLYRPPGQPPELHVFAVDDLLAEDNPHLPAWLPKEVKLKSRAG